MASKCEHLFPRLPFASWRVWFSGHWLWPLPICQLAPVRKDLWRCEKDARRTTCSSKLHHRENSIKYAYRILTMPVCTQLSWWIWDAEWGFCLVETGLQLQAGTGSFSSSPSHSNEKLPHMNYFLVWGCGKQARITRLHCTCQAVRASSWSGQYTSGGGEACRSASYGGDRASGNCLRYREYIETLWIFSEYGATSVWHRLPCCWHCCEFYICCDPTRGAAC